jgi:GNAT superfamily N-acetyltransferase
MSGARTEAMAAVRIRRTGPGDVDAVAALFDGYRLFYGQTSDPDGARRFIGNRLAAADSTILLAEADGNAIGFAQLYPSFSSVGMARIWVLNDLFVTPAHRGIGAGRALLEAAAAFGRESGARRLTLSTQVTNATAQAAYEASGWVRDSEFYVYNLQLTS